MANNTKKIYNVKNRSASVVVVRIPELGIRREFQPGETIKMTFNELEKFSFQPGGRELMANFLQIMEDEVNDSLGVPREEEYYMNEQQIIELLKNGPIDQFKDCLDFAPMGVIELVKRFAVELPLTDTVKIRALRDKTGFDVEKALDNKAAEVAPETQPEPVAAPAVIPKSGRRTAPSYKVVKKD